MRAADGQQGRSTWWNLLSWVGVLLALIGVILVGEEMDTLGLAVLFLAGVGNAYNAGRRGRQDR